MREAVVTSSDAPQPCWLIPFGRKPLWLTSDCQPLGQQRFVPLPLRLLDSDQYVEGLRLLERRQALTTSSRPLRSPARLTGGRSTRTGRRGRRHGSPRLMLASPRRHARRAHGRPGPGLGLGSTKPHTAGCSLGVLCSAPGRGGVGEVVRPMVSQCDDGPPRSHSDGLGSVVRTLPMTSGGTSRSAPAQDDGGLSRRAAMAPISTKCPRPRRADREGTRRPHGVIASAAQMRWDADFFAHGGRVSIRSWGAASTCRT